MVNMSQGKITSAPWIFQMVDGNVVIVPTTTSKEERIAIDVRNAKVNKIP